MIQDLIQRGFGVLYSVPYVAELLRNLGFSYQKARFISDHLDEARRQHWRTVEWPAILHLAPKPPRFRLPERPVAPTAHPLWPVGFEAGDEELPPWVAGLPDRPTVYATLGAELSRSPAGRAVFPMILAALRDEPVNLILTVGRDNDPAQFGPQPPHVHIARFIPQRLLLPHCDLVVHQGGFSTVTGALNAGLPMVVIPIGADQPYNAACCAALGVGAVIEAGARSAEAIRAAVHDVMDNPSYRRKAEQMRDEMAALPGPEHAVALLERLAVEEQPLLTS